MQPVRNRYRPYAGGVASRLATDIYVAMVKPILNDNSYSPNDSNLKYESYQPYGGFFFLIFKLRHLMSSMVSGNFLPYKVWRFLKNQP